MWGGAVNVLISGGFSSAYEQLLSEIRADEWCHGHHPIRWVPGQLAGGVPADVVILSRGRPW
jgi:hypothetical protein